jgi:hypothetical protein
MNKEMMEIDIERKFGVAVSLAMEFTSKLASRLESFGKHLL